MTRASCRPTARSRSSRRWTSSTSPTRSLYMASLPLDANVLFMTVMATKMPFVGRGWSRTGPAVPRFDTRLGFVRKLSRSFAHARNHPSRDLERDAHTAHHHAGRRPRAGLRPGRRGQPAETVAAGRLSGGRHRHRAVHAGLRRRPGPGAPAGRGRRHPADVRHRAAFLARRSAVGQEDRDSRRARPDGPGTLLGLGVGYAIGWPIGAGHHLRPGAVGRQHGGGDAHAAGQASAPVRAGPHRGRLAGRRRISP